jgi:predicted nucleic acid-binding protein
VSAIVVDTSVWIDFLSGGELPTLEDALTHGAVVIPPIVVAELFSGTRRLAERKAVADLLEDLALHDTPLSHWIRVGDLRRDLRSRGLTVSTPDAHVAQCALDVRGILLTRDAVFSRVAGLVPLRIAAA